MDTISQSFMKLESRVFIFKWLQVINSFYSIPFCYSNVLLENRINITHIFFKSFNLVSLWAT